MAFGSMQDAVAGGDEHLVLIRRTRSTPDGASRSTAHVEPRRRMPMTTAERALTWAAARFIPRAALASAQTGERPCPATPEQPAFPRSYGIERSWFNSATFVSSATLPVGT